MLVGGLVGLGLRRGLGGFCLLLVVIKEKYKNALFWYNNLKDNKIHGNIKECGTRFYHSMLVAGFPISSTKMPRSPIHHSLWSPGYSLRYGFRHHQGQGPTDRAYPKPDCRQRQKLSTVIGTIFRPSVRDGRRDPGHFYCHHHPGHLLQHLQQRVNILII